MMNGPSKHAVKVIRSLLSRPKTIYTIVADTGLPERTVKAQITALKESGAVRRKRFVPSHHSRGGQLAVYEPIIVEVK